MEGREEGRKGGREEGREGGREEGRKEKKKKTKMQTAALENAEERSETAGQCNPVASFPITKGTLPGKERRPVTWANLFVNTQRMGYLLGRECSLMTFFQPDVSGWELLMVNKPRLHGCITGKGRISWTAACGIKWRFSTTRMLPQPPPGEVPPHWRPRMLQVSLAFQKFMFCCPLL